MSKAGDDLLPDMDVAARELLKSVNGTTMTTGEEGQPPQPIDLKGRVAAFEAVTAYLAVKHKIQPAGVQRSGVDKYRDRINGRASGRGADRGQAAAGEAGADE